MASIIKKYQKCGKNNCHCQLAETAHGPYYWLVKYVKSRNSFSKGKYTWRYISRNPDDVKNFIDNNKHLKLNFDFNED